MGSVPIRGISLFAGTIAGASGPFTQQQAGRRSSESRTVVIVVRMATGFHGTCIRMAELFTKGADRSAGVPPAGSAASRRRGIRKMVGVLPGRRRDAAQAAGEDASAPLRNSPTPTPYSAPTMDLGIPVNS